jgi:hypothetical protein
MTSLTSDAFVVRNTGNQRRTVGVVSKISVKTMTTTNGSPLLTRLSSTTADKAEATTTETYE